MEKLQAEFIKDVAFVIQHIGTLHYLPFQLKEKERLAY